MPPTKRECLQAVHPASMPLSSIPYEHALLRSAAVQMEHLTGDPAWDSFLAKIETKRREYLSEAETWTEALKVAVDQGQVKTAQVNVAVFESCARLCKEMMELPGEILATHRKATPVDAVPARP